jgi:protein TonB
MTERAFGWWVLVSLGAHAVGILVVAPLATSADVRSTAPVEIQVVRVEPPPGPLKPPVRKERPAPPRAAKVAEPTQPLFPGPVPLPQEARRADVAPSSDASVPDGRFLAAASGTWSIPGGALDGPLGSGALLATPPVPSGGGSTDGPALASTQDGAGLTAFARPLGGYQTKPRYPESARREGVEGVTLLRFQVLATGRVGNVVVARSAGHVELDRSAIEAVKTWLFEPARRGKEAVTVWVVLPVRFSLQAE